MSMATGSLLRPAAARSLSAKSACASRIKISPADG
jgi:hypothetical protein